MAEAAKFDFIFEPAEQLDRSQLRQGDLLQRTTALASSLAEAHSYYAEALDYSHFLILTQSCDLVRRKGKDCKSRYITICAVRPLTLAVQRELDQYTKPINGCPIPIGDKEKNALARQFLERVANNTVDGMFFIPRGSVETADEHLCAFLPLSVALRVTHYDVCLSAKVGQVKDIFAAKIGSLASNLYSRIATPDVHMGNERKSVDAFMEGFFNDLGLRSVIWLTAYERSALEQRLSEALAKSGEEKLSEADALALIKALPNEADAIADRVVRVLTERKLLTDDPDILKKARNFLLNDSQYKKLAKR